MPKTPSSRHVIKSFQRKAEANRNFPEIIADNLTSSAGSMSFLFANVLFFTLWVVFNSGLIPNFKVFDPFPFGLLTMVVSLQAIILSILVLISQNRESRVAELVEEVNLQVNMIEEEEVTKMLELLILILEKHGINVSEDPIIKDMLKPTDLEKIEKALEKQIM